MARRGSGGSDPGGLVIVDKPAGFTSHDVVAKVRGMARTRRVGHAGTLDPMATGVLVLGVGRATRLLGHLALTEKEYLATIRLGQSTVTDDAEGEVTRSAGATTSSSARTPSGQPAPQVTEEALDAGITALTGDILQVPAKVSAIKIEGQRSYARVREGQEVELAARPITVSAFDRHDLRTATAADGTPVLDVVASVVCSSGTYVRALARDLGTALGTGGHLTALRRTRVGPYGLDRARTLEEHQKELALTPVAEAAAAAFPRWDVDARQAKLLSHGVRIDLPAATAAQADPKAGRPIAVFDPDGRFLALVEEHRGTAKSLAVFT